VAQHPGELTYGLFFDQNLSYSRYSTVIAPNPLLPGLAQRPVLMLQDGDVQQYQVLRDALTGAPTSKERKQELASFLSMHLEKPHERKAAIDRAATPQDDLTTKRLKYVLSGTISTNGLELRCLAYSLVKPKPWRQAIGVPKTTRRKLQSVSGVSRKPGTIYHRRHRSRDSQDSNSDHPRCNSKRTAKCHYSTNCAYVPYKKVPRGTAVSESKDKRKRRSQLLFEHAGDGRHHYFRGLCP